MVRASQGLRLAADLLRVRGPGHRAATDPPFHCRCGERDRISIKCEVPSAGDWWQLTVRRPAGIRQTQTWQTVKLGDDIKNTVRELSDQSQWFVQGPRKARGEAP